MPSRTTSTIIVITHLDELKAAFPVRIEVVKEPVTGSTFDIIGADRDATYEVLGV